jgi:hypothetical protein
MSQRRFNRIDHRAAGLIRTIVFLGMWWIILFFGIIAVAGYLDPPHGVVID